MAEVSFTTTVAPERERIAIARTAVTAPRDGMKGDPSLLAIGTASAKTASNVASKASEIAPMSGVWSPTTLAASDPIVPDIATR